MFFKLLQNSVFKKEQTLKGWNTNKIKPKQDYKFAPSKKLTILIIQNNNTIFRIVIFDYWIFDTIFQKLFFINGDHFNSNCRKIINGCKLCKSNGLEKLQCLKIKSLLY